MNYTVADLTSIPPQTCPCGQTRRAFVTPDNPVASLHYVDISVVSLDDPEQAAPELHLWTESKLAWFETGDALPRYATDQRPKRYS